MSEYLENFPYGNFAEKEEERWDYAGILIASGNARELVLYCRQVNMPLRENNIKIALEYAREKLAVEDYLFGKKILNDTLSQDALFSLAIDCVLAGKLIGLKALEQDGFNVRVAQKHSAISQKLLLATGRHEKTVTLLEQKYGYLREWVELITKGRGWQNEEEREYAYKILREAQEKEENNKK